MGFESFNLQKEGGKKDMFFKERQVYAQKNWLTQGKIHFPLFTWNFTLAQLKASNC